jgi:D-xylose 1-dehydrogenase (NADP+, D-xylono-1,5-lactone-forming)
MTNRIRWGILGTGDINRKVLRGARLSSDLEVVAVASRDADRAATFANEHGIPRSFGTYEAMLDDPDVDAVYICVPNSLHHPWTMTALAAGKHVLCEKPYTRHPDEVTVAFDAAERAGLVLMEAFMWRHTPQTQRLLELLPRIGTLQTVRATFSFPLKNPDNIRLRSDLDGGSLMDVGCYCVSGARLLAGEEPKAVYATQDVGPSGVDLRLTGVLRFPSGVVAEFTSAFTTDHESLEAIGTEGSIRLPDPWHNVRGVFTFNDEEIRLDPGNPYQAELENVGAAIRGEAEPRLGRADALGQARAIAALYASAETGAEVRLDGDAA